MSRIELSWRRTLFFLAAFLFALLAFFPLRLGLSWFGLEARGLSAREAEGSIWLGTLREARMGPLQLGDATVRLGTLPLFLGRARFAIERRGDEDGLDGAVSLSRHGFAVEDLTGSLRVAEPVAGLPLRSLEAADLSVAFSGGVCRSADGLARASLGELGGIGLPGTLSGNARCDGGAFLLPLASQSGAEAVNLRLFEDGRYRAELVLRPSDAAAGERLRAAGFAATASGYVLRVDGRF